MVLSGPLLAAAFLLVVNSLSRGKSWATHVERRPWVWKGGHC